MLVKRGSRNRLTLPKAAVRAVSEAEYFHVAVEEGRIVLTPVRTRSADAVRARIEWLSVTDENVTTAVAWARRTD